MSLLNLSIENGKINKPTPKIVNTDISNINKTSDISLYCGDCLDILKSMKSDSIDLIVTDPPYDISCTNGGGTINTLKKFRESMEDLVESDITNGYDIFKYNEEFVRVMKDINIYIWCNKKQIPDYFKYYVEQQGCAFEILTWHKVNALPTYSNKYITDTEFCLYFHKGKGRCFPQNYEDAKTYFFAPLNQTDKKKYQHPTIKPVDFIAKMIRNSSVKGDIILDPFMGSGTTGVACKYLNRSFIGIELNEKWYNIAKERINV